ncbi:hypothetical protein [Cupriavidus necator]
MERKHCLAWIALSMIAAALLMLLCLILNDHAETQAARKVRQMAGRVNADTRASQPAHQAQRLPPAVSTAQR